MSYYVDEKREANQGVVVGPLAAIDVSAAMLFAGCAALDDLEDEGEIPKGSARVLVASVVYRAMEMARRRQA